MSSTPWASTVLSVKENQQYLVMVTMSFTFHWTREHWWKQILMQDPHDALSFIEVPTKKWFGKSFIKWRETQRGVTHLFLHIHILLNDKHYWHLSLIISFSMKNLHGMCRSGDLKSEKYDNLSLHLSLKINGSGFFWNNLKYILFYILKDKFLKPNLYYGLLKI